MCIKLGKIDAAIKFKAKDEKKIIIIVHYTQFLYTANMANNFLVVLSHLGGLTGPFFLGMKNICSHRFLLQVAECICDNVHTGMERVVPLFHAVVNSVYCCLMQMCQSYKI